MNRVVYTNAIPLVRSDPPFPQLSPFSVDTQIEQLLQQPHLPPNALECFHHRIEIFARVRGTYLTANARLALRHNREAESRN